MVSLARKEIWFRGIFHLIGILGESPFVSKLRKAESAHRLTAVSRDKQQKIRKDSTNEKRFRTFIVPSRFWFPAFMIFNLQTAFHDPALFFGFKVGLWLSNGKAAWIIRSSEVQALVASVPLHSPICADTLD